MKRQQKFRKILRKICFVSVCEWTEILDLTLEEVVFYDLQCHAKLVGHGDDFVDMPNVVVQIVREDDEVV